MDGSASQPASGFGIAALGSLFGDVTLEIRVVRPAVNTPTHSMILDKPNRDPRTCAVNPRDLMEAARALTQPGDAPPTQARLRRAVSTAYYAVFHCLVRALRGAFEFCSAKLRACCKT